MLFAASLAESQIDKLLWKFTVSFARLCGTQSVSNHNTITLKNKPTVLEETSDFFCFLTDELDRQIDISWEISVALGEKMPLTMQDSTTQSLVVITHVTVQTLTLLLVLVVIHMSANVFC